MSEVYTTEGLDEFQALLYRNTDLDGFQTSISEWSQIDLLALINAAEAELTKRHAVPEQAQPTAGT
jgi:hypothetical protein